MKHLWASDTPSIRGFTVVEIIIVIVVIGLLATVGMVSYAGLQQRARETAVMDHLNEVSADVENYALQHQGAFPDSSTLASIITPNADVSLSIAVTDSRVPHESGYTGPVYTGLSDVQNAVLFHETCQRVIARPEYSTLYSHDRSAINSSYTIWCGSADGVTGINHDSYQINGWNSTPWPIPVTAAGITARIDAPPTDSWWDTATLDKATYTAIRDEFLAAGGTFPITTFWDSWMKPEDCTIWWCGGILKEPLPSVPEPPTHPLDPATTPNELALSYCMVATHVRHPSIVYSFSSTDLKIKKGNCTE